MLNYPESRRSLVPLVVTASVVLGVIIALIAAAGTHYALTRTVALPAVSISEVEDDNGAFMVARFDISTARVERSEADKVIARAKKTTVVALRTAQVSGNEVSRVVVQGWLPVVDDYGVITVTAVVNLTYTPTTLRKIHLDTVPTDSVWSLSDAGTVLPLPLWSR